MPYDATIEVMLPTRGGSWAQEFHGSYRVGTVIAVYVPPKKPLVIAMPRTGYVHVTGIPDSITPQRLSEVLTRPWEDDGRNRIERRVWRARVGSMVDPGKTVLLVDRQIETTWERLKGLSDHLVEKRRATDEDFA